MCRLRATRVTVSLPYLHKKPDAFGKDHDQEIKNCVKMESERLELRQKVSPEKIEEDSVSEKIEGIQKTQSPSNSKGIDDIMKSFREIQSEILGYHKKCMSTEQTNQPPSEYTPMEIDDFSIITDVVHSFVTKVEHHLSSSDQPEVDLKETPHQRIMPTRIDPGRKLVFDNIDYEQNVHHMTEEHQSNNIYVN